MIKTLYYIYMFLYRVPFSNQNLLLFLNVSTNMTSNNQKQSNIVNNKVSSLTSKYLSKMLDEKKYNSWHEEGFFDHSYY
jgi:hypothetical protein